MNIIWHKPTRQFHLYNERISYIMGVSIDGGLEHIYFGRRIHDKEDFSYVSVRACLPNIAVDPDTESYSCELNAREYPAFGTTDFGTPAYEIECSNGSRISGFSYVKHEIYKGKRKMTGLPATYAEEDEAMTLDVFLEDEVAKVTLVLSYTIFENYPVIARHVTFKNEGKVTVKLNRALSACVDFKDQDFEWVQFSGAWARERFPEVKKLSTGMTAIESRRGVSSAFQNPFVIIKRPGTDDFQGEAYGFSLVYSGNFIAMAEGNNYNRMRVMMGIHPDCFSWPLEADDIFDTPEVVIAMTDSGLNDLSQTYHRLYNNHLVRGKWKNVPRPIVNNNWEATFMDFTEEKILTLAKRAKEAGVELFVLDDGWFGSRNDDYSGLGDWVENPKKLPQGMKGLATKMNAMGLQFGFWIEPEMVNPDSNLYRRHPEWVLSCPGRKSSLGRHQLVLDFSREEVVNYIFDMLSKVLEGTTISYIKWDMNRALTEVFSYGAKPIEQGMVYHKYILGVYRLYEMLISHFPDILFESCSSGGNRFDAGMLYYAPQAWCSDNTDAIDRIKIQYGSTFGYPVSSIGSHVSQVPNQQTGREVSLDTRGNVAYFGTFGYELDLNELNDAEFLQVKAQIEFMKENRELIQYGDFYRLKSPFETDEAAWMVVSQDRKHAIVGFYRLRGTVNSLPGYLKLAGLDKDLVYRMEDEEYYGDELMNMGITLAKFSKNGFIVSKDFESFVTKIDVRNVL